ncbi:hypothetical protein NEOCIP111885_00770 [Pseudoneobacillus rhizosphaerae]|uniref:Uncharacterized protein n=1 Tax=Pseudoneobacillus rhizosphaerae TaxID=2880968 RepID=A0A9C7LA52_9BACI|nr:hypothetical protein NEOCIP111885_00770 [Pseudoneobacillus rhizosphaerae]
MLTHSQSIYGTPVETCRPYPRDYMSECILLKIMNCIIGSKCQFVNKKLTILLIWKNFVRVLYEISPKAFLDRCNYFLKSPSRMGSFSL